MTGNPISQLGTIESEKQEIHDVLDTTIKDFESLFQWTISEKKSISEKNQQQGVFEILGGFQTLGILSFDLGIINRGFSNKLKKSDKTEEVLNTLENANRRFKKVIEVTLSGEESICEIERSGVMKVLSGFQKLGVDKGKIQKIETSLEVFLSGACSRVNS